jgi:hypothetical protein
MPDRGSGHNAEQDGRAGGPGPGGADVGAGPASGRAAPPTRRRRGAMLAAYVTAGALAVGAGFGLARAVSPGPKAISSAIPSPAQSGGVFVEDDNLTAQDLQTNILAVTAPGLVHILSGPAPVGIGLVLTPSGKVLTSYVPASRAENLSAEYVVSGAIFKARVIGTDPAAGLALLQMEGGDGRAFATLQVGNSATLAADTEQSRQFSWHMAGEVTDTAVGTSGTLDALTLDVGTLISMDATVSVRGGSQTGLMESVLQSPATTEIGGPLVNLNGQVIGITVAGAGSGLDLFGYAIPINRALAIAARMATGRAAG